MAMYPPISGPTATHSLSVYASSSSTMSLGTHSLRPLGSDPAKHTDVSSTDVPTGIQSTNVVAANNRHPNKKRTLDNHKTQLKQHQNGRLHTTTYRTTNMHATTANLDDTMTRNKRSRETQQDPLNNRSHTRSTW